MDNSWIKLFRKARDNQIMTDPIAWTLFSYILLTVNRETGSMRTGRIYLSTVLKVNQSTIYKALKRLSEKYGLVTTVVTTKYTEITVSKWSIYQHNESSGNSEVTTKEQQSNTIQEERSKNNTNIISLLPNQLEKLKKEFPYLDVVYEYRRFKEWQKGTGKEFPNVLARFRAWMMQQEHEDKKETNVILEDAIFKQLEKVWKYNDGVGFIRKSDLQSRLGSKYPKQKYVREWEEVRKVLSVL